MNFSKGTVEGQNLNTSQSPAFVGGNNQSRSSFASKAIFKQASADYYSEEGTAALSASGG